MKLPAAFGFSISDDADPPMLTVRGEVDLASAPKLAAAMTELMDRGHTRVAIDLGSVEFIDSSGLGVLVGSLRRLREDGGDLVLRAASPPVTRILELTGLDGLLPVTS
ncbi:MAG TPA: STAS domain-containing protein [Acidimicrobiales bacterium]|jgi:anti-sigma B factor antagonist|nr:STAS domain-containing protein [Acidimicrobiales bacterium]